MLPDLRRGAYGRRQGCATSWAGSVLGWALQDGKRARARLWKEWVVLMGRRVADANIFIGLLRKLTACISVPQHVVGS